LTYSMTCRQTNAPSTTSRPITLNRRS
jgi:hypothetical protein